MPAIPFEPVSPIGGQKNRKTKTKLPHPRPFPNLGKGAIAPEICVLIAEEKSLTLE